MPKAIERAGPMVKVPSRVLMVLSLLLLILWPSGCRLIGLGETDPGLPPNPRTSLPMPQGTFQGFIEVDGGRVEGQLSLTPGDGAELQASFAGPPDLLATGPGGMYDDEINLNLRYEGDCSGSMTLMGTWEPGPGRLTGVVQARDCTGQAEGTFLFTRR